MNQFIALLRAVNVGRTGKVDMAKLCNACEAAGFRNVESYINSGNLLFGAEQSRDQALSLLQDILARDFALLADRVMLRTPAELQRTVSINPFADIAARSPHLLHVHFLASEPRPDADLMLTSYKGPEQIRRIGDHVYIDYPAGAGASGLTNSFLAKALGSVGTSRNWNTCQKLLAMARQRQAG